MIDLWIKKFSLKHYGDCCKKHHKRKQLYKRLEARRNRRNVKVLLRYYMG